MIAIVVTVVIIWAALLAVVIGMFRIATGTPTPQRLPLSSVGNENINNEPLGATTTARPRHGLGRPSEATACAA
jgi:hypothetical protein